MPQSYNPSLKLNIVSSLLVISIAVILNILLDLTNLQAQEAADPMLPTSSKSEALVSTLKMVTIVTNDMDAARSFYQGGLGMTATFVDANNNSAALYSHYGLQNEQEVEMILFSQPTLPDAGIVRVIKVEETLPLSRPGYESRHVGPLGFGFPSTDLKRRESILKLMGFGTTAGVMEMDFPRADETTYTVGEMHLMAPDDVLVLGVDRDTMKQIGPIDEALDIGGVAYSSMLVSNNDTMHSFLEGVLGLERRRAMSFKSGGPGGGMIGLKKGEEVTFQQWFSQGSDTGYLVIMNLVDRHSAAPATPDMNSRGISMWSFESMKLNEVVERARASGQSIDNDDIRDVYLPNVGMVRSVILRTPDNFPVEVYQRTHK